MTLMALSKIPKFAEAFTQYRSKVDAQANALLVELSTKKTHVESSLKDLKGKLTRVEDLFNKKVAIQKQMLVKEESLYLKDWRLKAWVIHSLVLSLCTFFIINYFTHIVHSELPDLIIACGLSALAIIIFAIIKKTSFKKNNLYFISRYLPLNLKEQEIHNTIRSLKQKIDKRTVELSELEKDFNAQVESLKRNLTKDYCTRERLKVCMATRVIKKFWKNRKGREDFSGRFGIWLRRYHDHFTTHTLRKDRVEATLLERRLKPGEMVFRETQVTEYREKDSESPMVFPETLLKPLSSLPGAKEHGLKFTLYLPGIDISHYPYSYNPEEWILPLYCEEVRFSPPHIMFDTRFKAAFYDWFNTLDQQSRQLGSHHFFIMKDQLVEKSGRVDTILTQHYQNMLKYASRTTLEESPRDRCYKARHWALGDTTLRPDLRMLKKESYCWNSGDVMVLCGNLERELISKDYGPILSLLAPFENRGEFFCLDLQRDDIIILGPQSILEKYTERFPQDKMVYIESLTPRQKNRLKVPFRLDLVGTKAKVISREGSF